MNPSDLIHFCPPGRLIIGTGARAQLPALVHHLGWKKGVIVTDKFFTAHTPWVREYIDAAQALGIETRVFDGGAPDPSTTLCDAATKTLLEGNYQPDHLIALGGGSNIDLAKGLCLTLPTNRRIHDFVAGVPEGVRPLPLVAVPTTAGTGSEATPGAIMIDPENATKVAVMDNSLRPAIALVDPELTYTCPPRVTGDSGIDAFTHAIESYITQDSTEFDRAGSPDPGYSGRSTLTMMFAREAVSLCAKYLKRTYVNGSDTEARCGMAYASNYAALSYGSSGLHAVHGLAYAVAGLTHRSHGSTNAVMLPYVLDNLRDVREKELAEVAGIFGIQAATPAKAASLLAVAVRDLVAALDLPTTLHDFGIAQEQLPRLIEDGLQVTRLAKAFPKADVKGAYTSIVHNAWAGVLSGETARA
ncbi:iron-containing alcohol dehydrogenase [Castellaniella sp. FW104-16D08]|uniref:iron-containing alcohol dehydrogenase n=1 Tax=unclassified Castellaniella TaxID=2617606 RepID=UPI0033158DEA